MEYADDQFEWDEEKAVSSLERHGVSFDEAKEVFADPGAVPEYDPDHSTTEERRYAIIGLSSRRLLFVVYTERDAVTRIIHARKASKAMKEIYEDEST